MSKRRDIQSAVQNISGKVHNADWLDFSVSYLKGMQDAFRTRAAAAVAKSLREGGHPTLARKLLAECLIVGIHDAYTACILARLMREQGDAEKALALLEAVPVEQCDDYVFCTRASVLLDLGDLDGAESELQKCKKHEAPYLNCSARLKNARKGLA